MREQNFHTGKSIYDQEKHFSKSFSWPACEQFQELAMEGETFKYRAEKKSLQILLSSTQAGPGRKVKQEQEEISRNHVEAFNSGSVHLQ